MTYQQVAACRYHLVHVPPCGEYVREHSCLFVYRCGVSPIPLVYSTFFLLLTMAVARMWIPIMDVGLRPQSTHLMWGKLFSTSAGVHLCVFIKAGPNQLLLLRRQALVTSYCNLTETCALLLLHNFRCEIQHVSWFSFAGTNRTFWTVCNAHFPSVC